MKSNHNLIIETERLLIVPMTFNFVSKVLNNDITAYNEFNIKPADEWPNLDTREILPIIRDKLSVQCVPSGFNAWLFIDKSDSSIVGDGGFKGPPDDNGEIDIGYGIIESRRRQGYALEAVTALIKWGLSRDNVKAITADCLKGNTASLKILKKSGMTEIKQDEEKFYFKMCQGTASLMP